MPDLLQRRSAGAIASACAAALALTGCAPSNSLPGGAGSSTSASASAAPPLDLDAAQRVADQLRASVPCTDSDALLDDLAFWDAMRGYDCLDDEPTFIRVYAHSASVPQTLQDWDGTFSGTRSVARGANWYVIGPPSTLATLDAPDHHPKLAEDIGVPVPLTAEQDYLTTCALFIGSEGERYVRQPRGQDESDQHYEELFPGVAAELHSAIDELGPERIRSITDADRWKATLSAVGPRVKKQCKVAHREVLGRVQSVESK